MSTVLVTGAGGHATCSIIEHLQRLGHRVIGADANEYGSGLYLADAGYVIPMGKDYEWPGAIRRICRSERVDVLVPLVDEELLPAWELDGDVQILAPRPDFIRLALDKLRCTGALSSIGVPVPYTTPFDGQFEPFYPSIVKPRTGRGSRGITRVNSHGELLTKLIDRTLTYSDQFIAQQYIDGPEYTVSVVCWRDGEVHAVVPKLSLHKKVATQIGVTKRHEQIDRICRKIQQELRADGPFNVQFREDADGTPYVIEINPRYAGSSPLTLAAGCDEIGGLIELAMGRPYTFGEWREDVVMIRRNADEFIAADEFQRRAPRGP